MSKALGEPHSDASILSSYFVPLFQNESPCKNSSYKNELDLHDNEPVEERHFLVNGLRHTKTCFHTEAKGNSKMAKCGLN